ncbi:MAG: tetratricopeptide repeat protein [Bacteroidota bacterium]
MKPHALFFAIIFSLFQTATAQDQASIDSLYSIIPQERDTNRLEVLVSLFIEYMYYDVQKSRELINEYAGIAEELGETKYIATGKNLSGILHNMTSHFEESLVDLEIALDLYEQIDDKRMMSLVLNNMANSYRDLGKLTESLECHLKSLELKKEMELPAETIAPSYWNIGNTLGDIENYEESNKYYDKALEIYEDLNYVDDIMELKYMKVMNMEHIDSTLNLVPQVEEYIEHCRNKNYSNSLAGALDHLGNIHRRKGNYIQSESNYLEALKLAEQNGEESLPGLVKRHLVSLYLKQNLYQKALPYAEASLVSSEEFSTKKKQIHDYKVLADIYEGLNDYQAALSNYKNYHLLNSDVLSQENINYINELEIGFEAKEKEAEIALLTKEKEIDEAEKRSLWTGLVLLIALVFALVIAIRQRSKAAQIRQEKVRSDLNFKKKELLAYTTQLAHKNEVLEKLKTDLVDLKPNEENPNEMNSIIRSIDFNLKDDANWDAFKQRFENVHEGFTQRLLTEHPELSSGDLRLIALLKMQLNSKEIANLLNISQEGIKKARYRLRKKMNLESGDSLENRILTF